MTSPKAPLLTRLNRLKEAASPSLLTESQQAVLKEIKGHREDDARFINLHGDVDTGKTFLCWVLQQSAEWEYHQALPDHVSSPAVIYDHADPERMATRALRNHATINGVATVIYVTRQPAEEIYPRVKIEPNNKHYKTISDNWADISLDTADAPSP